MYIKLYVKLYVKSFPPPNEYEIQHFNRLAIHKNICIFKWIQWYGVLYNAAIKIVGRAI